MIKMHFLRRFRLPADPVVRGPVKGMRNVGWAVFVSVVAAWGLGFALPATAAEQTPAAGSRPNVILLLLDDAGWTDTGRFGGRMLTPHLDRLAAEGMCFTDAHSPAPNCSPSRTGILTGRIPARAGIYSYLPEGHPMHLRAEEITVAELARQAGYRTGHFGKWHLSDLDNPSQPGPLDQGFEFSLGTSNNAAPSHRDPVNFYRNGERVGKLEGYSCQIVVNETLEWLDASGADKKDAAPFLACVWFHEPHTPIASPPELVEACLQRHPELSRRAAEYLANIENVDGAVGRLLAWLDARGLARDTVIWFTSDNGPLNAFSKGDLRGFKSNVWEGGHRVPAIVRWPGRIAPESTCHVPVSGVDFLPTFCDLAGIALPRDRMIDGASQLPLWLGRESDFVRSTPLYWYFYRLNPSLALRDGQWAIVAHTDDADRPKAHPLLREDMPRVLESKPASWELYHLGRDRGQTRDLSADQPQRLDTMKRQLAELHADVLAEDVRWDIPENYRSGTVRRVWNSE
jgi:arylsulfatase A